MKIKSAIRYASALALSVCAISAHAIPELQLYIEGATYDAGSWVFSGSGSFRLWAIGNVDGPGGKGAISNVKLSVAYDSGSTPTITFSPSTAGGYGGYADPSTPAAPVFSKTVTDGSAPVLGDGSSLPPHSIYGAGTSWTEFKLGDFTLTDSQIGDFMNTFPTASGAASGQINVYEVTVTGATTVHFDLYNSVPSGNDVRYVNAPFSHDGDGTGTTGTGGGGTPVPEGGATLLLLGAGFAAAGFARRFAKI